MIQRLSKRLSLLTMLTLTVGCGRELDFDPIAGESALTLASAAQLAEGKALPGSYVVAFRSEMSGNNLFFSSFENEFKAHYGLLADRFLGDPRISDLNFLTSVDLGRPNDLFWQADFEAPRGLQLAWNENNADSIPASLARVDFVSPGDAEEALKEWEADGRIWFAEPNYQSELFESKSTCLTATKANTFADVKKSYQSVQNWWFKEIKLLDAFTELEKYSDADAPIIAVMDSGVDYEHPALKNAMWVNESPGASGCANDVYGCNTSANSKGVLGNGDVYPFQTDGPGQACPQDSDGRGCPTSCCHGSHVAGIIAAAPVQYAGVCPVCKIMAIRIFGKTPEGKSSILDTSIIAGMKYVTRFRKGNSLAVRVINASFGKFIRSKSVSLLVRNLKNFGNGTLVVAAAGNEDTMLMAYPAAYREAVAVSNIQDQLIKHRTSNFGRWVDVGAPGDESGGGIISSIPGGGSERKPGTSMAAPVVAGVAGLVLVKNPDISFSELRNSIVLTANPKIYDNEVNQAYYPAVRGQSGRLALLGSGLVDAQAAVSGTKSTNLPILTGLDRVSSQCGTIGVEHQGADVSIVTMLLILLPVAVAAAYARRGKKIKP